MKPALRHLPIPVKRAQRIVAGIHRRLPRVTGGLWAIAALRGSEMVGVAVVGRPSARMSDTAGELAPQPNLEVLRVAVREGDRSETGNKGACSMLYGACARTARGMGAENLFTYIHKDEPGTTLKAAGWACLGEAGGGEWGRDHRPRQKAIDSEEKVVWFAPWSLVVRASVLPPASPSPSPAHESRPIPDGVSLAPDHVPGTHFGEGAVGDLSALAAAARGDGCAQSDILDETGAGLAPGAAARETDCASGTEGTTHVGARAHGGESVAAPAAVKSSKPTAPPKRISIMLVGADGSEKEATP